MISVAILYAVPLENCGYKLVAHVFVYVWDHVYIDLEVFYGSFFENLIINLDPDFVMPSFIYLFIYFWYCDAWKWTL